MSTPTPTTAVAAELSTKIAEILSGYVVTATPVAGVVVDGKVEVDREIVASVLAARAAEEAATRAKVRAEAILKSVMGDTEEATIEGETVFTWKHSEVSRLDQSALKEQRPEVFAHFIKVSPERRLLAKPKILAKFFA